MTTLGVDGVSLTASGSGVQSVSKASLALLADAHRDGKTSELLFSNYSDQLEDFSDPLAEKMLDSSSNRASVIQALSNDVNVDGWDGITIDLESLNGFGEAGHLRDDNAHLVDFAAALKNALGPGKTMSICVSASTGSYANLGYNLHALSKRVDDVVLMAYDQHGPQWTGPGPVGGYPWVKQTLANMLKSVPASKVQLGIAEYGYSWPQGQDAGGDGDGKTYSDAGARAFITSRGGVPVWSATQKEWTARLADGTVLWWSDRRSFVARLVLAHDMKLGGVAMWSLRYGDPLDR